MLIDEHSEQSTDYVKKYQNVKNSKQAVVVGAGPAGLFSALRLIELGVKPIVLERGKDVRERRRDLASINKEHNVNPESNYCFGEGGAGTYSDGKLYTRSKKRGDVRSILETLVAHGSKPDILFSSSSNSIFLGFGTMLCNNFHASVEICLSRVPFIR